MTDRSGASQSPLPELILPFSSLTQRPLAWSRNLNCTVRSRSCNRPANSGWVRAVNFSACTIAKSMIENFMRACVYAPG